MENDKEFEGQSSFGKNYSEQSLFEKIKSYAQKAGLNVIYAVLLLFYALQNASTPLWAKGTIVGALGYFISPIDAIPDVTPIIGFTDDYGVLLMALATVAMYINEDVKSQARSKICDWFGIIEEDVFKDIDDKLKR